MYDESADSPVPRPALRTFVENNLVFVFPSTLRRLHGIDVGDHVSAAGAAGAAAFAASRSGRLIEEGFLLREKRPILIAQQNRRRRTEQRRSRMYGNFLERKYTQRTSFFIHFKNSRTSSSSPRVLRMSSASSSRPCVTAVR